ncbi:hypothetical protein QZH41_002688 [Actinostola sp. cb2023]|nr:hypothetical protein QZH41_002688 [Actinostola sp. cb2023]
MEGKLLEVFRLGLANEARRKKRNIHEPTRRKVQQHLTNYLMELRKHRNKKSLDLILENYINDLKGKRPEPLNVIPEKYSNDLNGKRSEPLNVILDKYVVDLSGKRTTLGNENTATVSKKVEPGLGHRRRFRRAADAYRVQVTSIKRTSDQSENVDINYRVLDGNKIVPAQQVTESSSKLTTNQISYIMKYPPSDLESDALPLRHGVIL